MSTEPTDKGAGLTVYDYYYPVKRVVNRPLGDKAAELWLLALEAEAKGLIRLNITFDEHSDNKGEFIEKRLLQLFLLSPAGQADGKKDEVIWEKVRTEVISKLVKEHALPDFEQYYRQAQTERAQKAASERCAAALRALISARPYRAEGTAILSCSNDQDAAYFAFLTPTGDVAQHLKLINVLRKGGEGCQSYKVLYDQDMAALRAAMTAHMPDLIMVMPKNLRSRYMKVELDNMAKEVYEHLQRQKPFVMWSRGGLAAAFGRSGAARRLLGDCPTALKEAISAGRYAQNPAAEVLNLWHEDDRENGVLELQLD